VGDLSPKKGEGRTNNTPKGTCLHGLVKLLSPCGVLSLFLAHFVFLRVWTTQSVGGLGDRPPCMHMRVVAHYLHTQHGLLTGSCKDARNFTRLPAELQHCPGKKDTMHWRLCALWLVMFGAYS